MCSAPCDRRVTHPEPRLTRGYDAAVYGALLAGCRAFHGGASDASGDLAHTAERLFPACGGRFVPAASEAAAFEAARDEVAAGQRGIVAASGAELWDLLRAAERARLPLVALHVRNGALASEVVPEGGEPAFLLAPASPQELAELTCLAFDLAERHRRPAVVLADPFLGQMVEPVSLPCVTCDRQHGKLGSSLASCPGADPLPSAERLTAAARYEEAGTEDAEVLLVSWGGAARVLRRAMLLARAQGLRVGLLRPVTLAPFPAARLADLASAVRAIVLLEPGSGPGTDAVRTAVGERAPISLLCAGAGTGLASAEGLAACAFAAAG
jgi:2-oxoglutarate ferredoxin oxidoreductase subunit alpha